MKKFELYLDKNKRLVLSEFKDVEAEYESKVLEGKEAYEYIKKLSSSKIVDIYVNAKKEEAILEYKNFAISLNEYNELLSTKSMNPILHNIKEYNERKELSNLKSKKVKRKNKHTGKKVIATGLAAFMLVSCAHGLLSKKEIQLENNSAYQSVSSENIVYNDSNDSVSIITTANSVDKKVENENAISLNYEDRSLTEKAYITQAYYSDMITKYANMYGVDPSLAIAVATQESGIHSSKLNPNRGTGLMQIETPVWLGEKVTAYNFETKTIESFTVTSDKLQDVKYNIKMGCMILQNSLEYMNYNALAAIQCYNMGYGNMKKILNSYASEKNKSIDAILSDQYDTGWLNHRNIIENGDQEYIEHVLSWMGDDINVKFVRRDGSLIDINIDNDLSTKKVY